MEKVEQLIRAINHVHQAFSQEYIETNIVDKVDLSNTIDNVPTDHILNYRLYLHESINDYLMEVDLKGIDFFYRVKSSERILDKIERYSEVEEQLTLDRWMNDIFACRMLLSKSDIATIVTHLDDWRGEYGLLNWDKYDNGSYKGVHLYFKDHEHFCFPWELQLWNVEDLERNIRVQKRASIDFLERHFGYAIPDEHEREVIDSWFSMTEEERREGSITLEEYAKEHGIEL